MNIISCTINNNLAFSVSTRADFEQRAHHNAPLELPILVITRTPVDVLLGSI